MSGEGSEREGGWGPSDGDGAARQRREGCATAWGGTWPPRWTEHFHRAKSAEKSRETWQSDPSAEPHSARCPQIL